MHASASYLFQSLQIVNYWSQDFINAIQLDVLALHHHEEVYGLKSGSKLWGHIPKCVVEQACWEQEKKCTCECLPRGLVDEAIVCVQITCV